MSDSGTPASAEQPAAPDVGGQQQTVEVPELLVPAILKLTHANEHFAALGREVRGLLDAQDAELAADPPDGQGWRIVRIGSVPVAPYEWGAILGDGVHDCRSALDNAVAALTRLAGGGPTILSEFPILVDEPEAKREKKLDRALVGIPRLCQDEIRGAQPYLAGEGRSAHPLAVLQTLSNADKHRLVHIATIAPTEAAYRYRTAKGNRVIEERPSTAMVWHTGSEVLRVRVAPDPAAALGVEMEFSLSVGFAPSRTTEPVVTMRGLAQMWDYLWRLLSSLTPYFRKHIRVASPDAGVEPGSIVRVEPSHEHARGRVGSIPDGDMEKLVTGGVLRTFRRYRCPECGAASFVDVAADVDLA